MKRGTFSRQLCDENGNPVPGALDTIRWARDIVIPRPKPRKPTKEPIKPPKSNRAPSSYKAMLLVLASRANESLAVWTSPRTLGENIQIGDERTVRRMVEELAGLGFLRSAPTYRLKSKADGVNVYVVNTEGWLNDIGDSTAKLIARLRFLEEATQVSNTPLHCAFKD